MGNEKKTPVTIDGVEHHFEDMTQQQQMLLTMLPTWIVNWTQQDSMWISCR